MGRRVQKSKRRPLSGHQPMPVVTLSGPLLWLHHVHDAGAGSFHMPGSWCARTRRWTRSCGCDVVTTWSSVRGGQPITRHTGLHRGHGSNAGHECAEARNPSATGFHRLCPVPVRKRFARLSGGGAGELACPISHCRSLAISAQNQHDALIPSRSHFSCRATNKRPALGAALRGHASVHHALGSMICHQGASVDLLELVTHTTIYIINYFARVRLCADHLFVAHSSFAHLPHARSYVVRSYDACSYAAHSLLHHSCALPRSIHSPCLRVHAVLVRAEPAAR